MASENKAMETTHLDIAAIRQDFPVLDQEVHGKKLVYLDSAATCQTPRAVTDALRAFYDKDCANIHRGVYQLSQRATDLYEAARGKVRDFVNAEEASEIIFTRGTTEAINLVASSLGEQIVGSGDEVIVSEMEHHSNIVPWQMLCERKGATLKVIPINDEGELILEEYERLLSEKTRIVAVGHVSNALGSINPIKDIIGKAHKAGALVVVDGAQAVPHASVDVQDLDCDFYAFSGHKLYGPTGVGALYGKKDLLTSMPPWQGGGDMILSVTFEKTLYAGLPAKFEAGTPNIAGAIGLGAAIDYVSAIGMNRIAEYEQTLLNYATDALGAVPGLSMIGTAAHKVAVCSFELEGLHPHDIGTLLDLEGVAIRTGHHCAQPVMKRFGVPATSRASFGIYNTPEEVDALVMALLKAREVFGL
jgi:cysteine desulfurase/selenocysteine lyase